MKLKLGNYYVHHAGRKIHVVGEVTTDAWGEMWVVEDKDHTGSGMSCVEKKDSDLPDENWIEIGSVEWKWEVGKDEFINN